MTIQTHSYEHRGYEIVVTHTAPYFQAASIRKTSTCHTSAGKNRQFARITMGAITLAKGQIDSTFAALHIP